MMTFPFEDNWLDVVSKAMRGCAINENFLAKKSGLSHQAISSLLKGNRNEQSLQIIAPILSLNREALIRLAHEPFSEKEVDLPENIRQLTTSFHGMEVHSYLLWSEESQEAIAFDTGSDVTEMLKILDQKNLTLRHIFLTHRHADHIHALDNLVVATEATAWVSPLELVEKATPLPENKSSRFSCGQITIEAKSTPGHSSGGITYFVQGLTLPVAIVGDAIFARSIGGVAASSYPTALTAIRSNILSLPARTILCPGHGPLTTVQEELRYNPFFR